MAFKISPTSGEIIGIRFAKGLADDDERASDQSSPANARPTVARVVPRDRNCRALPASILVFDVSRLQPLVLLAILLSTADPSSLKRLTGYYGYRALRASLR